MPFPTVENGPWTFDVNNDESGGTFADTMKNVLFRIKESWIGFSPWSVVASSDSVSVKNIGDASPDLWIDTGDIVRNTDGNPHSWIILENSVNGEQVCFDYNGATDARLRIYVSPLGLFNTNGTTTNRPSSGGSTYLLINSIDFLATTADGAVVHSMISNDGKCTRSIVHCRDGSNNGDSVICVEEVVNTPSQWTGTHKRGYLRQPTSQALSATYNLKSPRYDAYDGETMIVSPPAGTITCNGTCECYDNISGDSAAPITKLNTDLGWAGGYPVAQIGLYSLSSSVGGAYGRFQDLYWAHYYHDTYDTYNAAASRAWIKIGCFMFPWNGVQPLEVP